jgi:hypothetical protein
LAERKENILECTADIKNIYRRHNKMGSGYFPLEKNSAERETIIVLLKQIRKIIDSVADYGFENSQIDNAFFDGCYIGRIRAGIELIENNI